MQGIFVVLTGLKPATMRKYKAEYQVGAPTRPHEIMLKSRLIISLSIDIQLQNDKLQYTCKFHLPKDFGKGDSPRRWPR